MTELEKAESELNRLKLAQAKSQGVMEQIEAKWKEEHDTTDPNEVQDILSNLEKRHKKLVSERDELLSEANKIMGGA